MAKLVNAHKATSRGGHKVDARLKRAESDRALVVVHRWIPNSDRVSGFVVGMSNSWILLAALNDRIELDGWKAVRREDIQSVTRIPTKNCFEIRALKARSMWPPVRPKPLRLRSVRDVLRMGSTAGPMIAIQREFERPDVAWIGAVRKIGKETLVLLEVNVEGGWARKPRRFDLDDITEVDFGGGYEEALSLVAGPAPKK
jgi:hypothetical protein